MAQHQGYSTFIINPLDRAASVTATYCSSRVAIGHTTINAPAGRHSTIPVNGVLAPGEAVFFIQS